MPYELKGRNVLVTGGSRYVISLSPLGMESSVGPVVGCDCDPAGYPSSTTSLSTTTTIRTHNPKPNMNYYV
jgi:hypothetical protein